MPPDSSSEPKTPRVSAVKFWLGAISAMILITGLLTYAWMPKGPPEPEYQGRTLTEWLKALNAANKGSAELKESEVAIRAIGTNGFPLLLHMMAEYDFKNPLALARLLKNGVKLHAYSTAIMKEAQKAAFDLYEEESGKNPAFKKIYEPWKKFRREQFQWNRVAEHTLSNFMLNNM